MNKKENLGITLVALVITIIVLIILAGVSINAVMNGGLISNAKNARNEYDKAKVEEETTLTDYELITHFSLNNSKYKCKYGYITGIVVTDAFTELASNLAKNLPEGYFLYDIEIDSEYNMTIKEEAIEDNDEGTKLKTGMVIKKDNKIVGKVVVFGDIHSDGEISGKDRSVLSNYITNGNITFPDDESFYVAMDINHDGIINIEDKDKLNTYLSDHSVDIQNVEAKKITQTN